MSPDSSSTAWAIEELMPCGRNVFAASVSDRKFDGDRQRLERRVSVLRRCDSEILADRRVSVSRPFDT